MEEGAGNLHSSSGSQVGTQKKKGTAPKRSRKRHKDHRPAGLSGKAEDKKRRKKRNQRKKTNSYIKGDADVKNDDSEKANTEVVETTIDQTQESLPVGSQPVDPQAEDILQTEEKSGEQCRKDAKTLQAETQTDKFEGIHKFSQTPVVCQSNQETQTEFPEPKQDAINDAETRPGTNNASESSLKQDDHTPESKLQIDDPVQTPLRHNENPDNDQASSNSVNKENLEIVSDFKEKNRSAGTSGDSQVEKGAKPKSYAKAVSGEGGSEKQPNMETSKAAAEPTKPSQSTCEGSPESSPPGTPMFTCHIYAVLDKKFKFKQDLDTLELHLDEASFPLKMTHFV